MTNTVTVGCKLPNGLVIDIPGKGSHKLAGARDSRIIGGYGLTPVPSDFWDAWLAANAKSDLVTKNIVFAQATQAKAEGQAKELEGVKTGLEQLPKTNNADGTPAVRR